jgi:EAL and modified HD-GYP domain-containing signal transduction protein
MSIGLDARNAVCVARQPILDQLGRVYGYELLYRAGTDAIDCTASGDLAGARVLSDAVLTLGLDALTCGRPAFVNFTRSLLLGEAGTLLPRDSTVIEIREDVAIDAEVMAACRSLHAKGFALALDDFVPGSPAEALLPFVRFVKVDVLQTTADVRASLATRLRPRGVRLIAEKVETAEMAAQALAVGYRLFQGYYFCRPTTFAATPMPARRLAYMGLLGALNRQDMTVDELEDLVKHDVSLSYRVLRSVNSWLYGLRNEVTSIRHALILLGLDQIRKWASVWALAGLNSSGTQETVTVALLRARCCELLGNALLGPEEGASYFLLGLCSLLDVILGRPMADALAEMPLAAEINDALLGTANRPREVLDAVVAYEQGKWEEAALAMARLNLPVATLPDVYADALRWARELSKTTKSA